MQFERTESYSAKVVVIYKGTNRIYAIKALRETFGIGLKEAKQSVEHGAGMEMHYTDYNAVTRCYQQALQGNGYDAFSGGWRIYSESKPIDLVR